MKTRNYLSVASILAFSIAFSSCTKEENFNNDYNKVITEFTATNELAGSRTMLSGTAVQWKGKETISVFNGTSMKQFVNTASGPLNAVFTGEIAAEGNIYALYPYYASATMTGGVITTSLPNNQTATANSFADGLNISVAKATAENKLAFKNACGLIKFTLSEAAQNITFTAGSAIAGEMTITVGDDGNITNTAVTNEDESNKTITLSGDLQANTAYYMVVPAGTYSNPTITVGSNTVTFDPDVTITIERGKIQPINITGSTAVTPDYTELTISSITEIEPVSDATTAAEGGTATTTEYDRLEIVLSSDVTLSDANNAKGGFEITVTNSNGLAVTEKYSVTNVELKSESPSTLILTLDKPVYTDDVVTVAYNTSGDFSGIKDSNNINWIKLTTAAEATFTGYKNTVYQFNFTEQDNNVETYFNYENNYKENKPLQLTNKEIIVDLSKNPKGQIASSIQTYNILRDAKYTVSMQLKKEGSTVFSDTPEFMIKLCQDKDWSNAFARTRKVNSVTNEYSVFEESFVILNNKSFNPNDVNYTLREVNENGKSPFFIHLGTNNEGQEGDKLYYKDVKITEEALRPGRSYSAGNTHEAFGSESSAIEGTYEVQ